MRSGSRRSEPGYPWRPLIPRSVTRLQILGVPGVRRGGYHCAERGEGRGPTQGVAEMAKRTTRQPPEEPIRPAALIVPRAEAEAKLAARIEKGEGLRPRLAEGSAEEEYKTWDAYNHDLLARIFSDGSIATEYDYAGPPARVINLSRSHDDSWIPGGSRRVQPDVSGKLDAKLAKLRSIRERLEVFDAPTEAAASSPGAASIQPQSLSSRKAAFIVHGHDGEAREATARVLGLLGVEAIILHERPNEGRTILEKFEKHSAEAPYAIVLLTGDDVGGKPNDLHARARQNVILELGFFWGSLGRERVCVLHERGVELPSDLQGLVRVEIDAGGGWRYQLARELRTLWPDIDLNRL